MTSRLLAAPALPYALRQHRCDLLVHCACSSSPSPGHLLQVDLALLPAVTGDFGVMPGHVPTVAQLRPGACCCTSSALGSALRLSCICFLIASACTRHCWLAAQSISRCTLSLSLLCAGVLTVHTELDKAIEKYFVSSGFAFVHADSSTDVCAVEAVKLDDLDADAVRSGLQVRTRGWLNPHQLLVFSRLARQ